MSSVLVAYASKYGSTEAAARAIAARLGERGVKAVARPARDVRDLEGYSAVVLGTALYFFMWRGEAKRFCSHNRRALSSMPVALFGLGPMEDTPEQFTGAREHLDKGLDKRPWLKPASVAVFGGRFDPEHLRFPDNNPAMRQMAPVDLLNLGVVGEWTDGLVDALGLEASPAS